MPAVLLSAGTMAVEQFPTGPFIPKPACRISRNRNSIATRTFCCVSIVCSFVDSALLEDVSTANPAAMTVVATTAPTMSSMSVTPC